MPLLRPGVIFSIKGVGRHLTSVRLASSSRETEELAPSRREQQIRTLPSRPCLAPLCRPERVRRGASSLKTAPSSLAVRDDSQPGRGKGGSLPESPHMWLREGAVSEPRQPSLECPGLSGSQSSHVMGKDGVDEGPQCGDKAMMLPASSLKAVAGKVPQVWCHQA